MARSLTHARRASPALLALLVLIAPASLPGVAGAQLSGLAGPYKAGSATTVAEVATWGTDCGPRPRSGTEVGQPSVTVKLQGTQLTLTFPDRTLRSDGCWSPNPNVRLVNATAANNRWRAECRTVDGDAKKERGVYTINASTPDVLELVEESDYDWQLNESHCVAKVRITQRVARGAAALHPPMSAPAAVTPTPTPTPTTTPCVPGALARLRLRPSDARIAPGEKVCFTVRGLDAAGCTLPSSALSLKWELEKPAGATGTLSGACFKAASSAAEAEGQFKVLVSSGAARDQTTVGVTSADLSDITARRSASELEVAESDDGVAEFGIEAMVMRSSWPVKVAMAALMFGCLAAAGWLLSLRLRSHDESEDGGRRSPLRRRKDSAAGRSDAPSSARSGASGAASSRPAPSSGAGEQLICPTCRRGYPGGTERCPKDGSEPIPYAEFTRHAQAADAGARTCTSCGTQLVGGALFCGSCGAKVRP